MPKPKATVTSTPKQPVTTFKKLGDAWLRATCERFPEFGTDLGLPGFDARLGRNLPQDHKDQNQLCTITLAAMEKLPSVAFSGDDYLDRRGFLALLRTHLLIEGRLARWQSDPQCHVNTAIQSIFSLVIRHTHSLGRALPDIESRLVALPTFLKNGATCVKAPVPIWTRLAVQACDGGVEFLRGLESELCGHSKSPTATKLLVDQACRALDKYAKAIQSKPPGPSNGFSIGRDAFEILMRERLGFDQSLPEIEADGWALIQRLESEIAEESKRAGFATVADALESGVTAWTPNRPLIEIYRETTQSIKDRVIALDLMTMPLGESLDVLPVPPFLRHQFPTAAYSAPPPFSKKQRGIFWVNDLSLTTEDPRKKLAEVRQHYGVELTAAHEAYPGHHLQFAIQNRHPSKFRRLFAHAIFYEGWTLWCEKMCVDQEIVDLPHVRIRQLHDALWRAYRIVIDCGLHNGTLSFDGACRLLMRGVGFTRARAEGDVNWYSSSPTVPMSYLLGRIEVERLHAHYVGKLGWSIKEFNDWMLSYGAIPWRWIIDSQLRPSPGG